MKEIFALIKEAPNIRIAYFFKENFHLAKELEVFCKEKGFEFFFFVQEKKLETKYQNEFQHIKYFPLTRPSFMLRGLFYDYVIIDFEIDKLQEFAKKIYKAIKNAGLIIFLTKNDKLLLDNYYQILEEANYVASSVIEMNQNQALFISKKMHGWN